jgi:NADP-dependent 3-hydroxy acid dehydrogenase YdfG
LQLRVSTIDAGAIAPAIAFALKQLADVSASEVIVRPTRSAD